MDWRDVSYFLAALRTGSFSKAAVLCRVKQSTVSRRIVALETALGGSLFHRSTRGLSPTELAEELLPHAEMAEHHLAQMQTLSQGRAHQLIGTVKLAMVPSMASQVLAPKLSEWREKYPGLKFECITSTMTTDLIRGEADIALRFYRPTHGELVVKKVASFRQGVLGSKQYLSQFTEPYEPQELDWIALDLPLLFVPESHWMKTHIKKPPILKTNDYTTMIEAVRHGLGVAMMSSNVILMDERLQEISVDLPGLPEQDLWLVTHNILRKIPRISAIWEELETICQQLY